MPLLPCVLSRRACGTKDEDIVLPPAKTAASTLNDTTGADDYADTDVARQILRVSRTYRKLEEPH